MPLTLRQVANRGQVVYVTPRLAWMGRTMAAYAFEFHWDGGQDASWTYLPTDDSARDYARILARNFKGGGQYRGATRLTVKNSDGTAIATISF